RTGRPKDRRRRNREKGFAPDQRLRGNREAGGRSACGERETGAGLPRGQGEGLQFTGGPGDEGDPGQGQSGPGQRVAQEKAELARLVEGRVALLVVVVTRVDGVGFALLHFEKLLLRLEVGFDVLQIVLQPLGQLTLALVLVGGLLVARLLLAELLDAARDLLGRLGVLRQRARAGIVDVLLARVGGEQRLVAPRGFACGRFLLALPRLAGLLREALLLRAFGVDALDDQPLRIQQLDRHALAFGGNERAVIALAVLGDAAVGFRLRRERKSGEHGGDGDESWAHGCCFPLAPILKIR